MINGISGMTGKDMAQMIAPQRSSGSAVKVDNDGDADDGGPARSGPDVDASVQGLESSGVKGTLFNAMA